MRTRTLALVLPLLLTAAAATAKPAAPDVPRGASGLARQTLTQAALLISKGQFAEATSLLKSATPGAAISVYVDWTPVPRTLRAGYGQAVEDALAEWNAALAPAQRFTHAASADQADVLVLFDRTVAMGLPGMPRLVCMQTPATPNTLSSGLSAEPQAALARPFEVRISLLVPYSTAFHQPPSIRHLVEEGLGECLGLGPTTAATDVMGPDSHGPGVAVKLSASEIARATKLRAARSELLGFAARREAITVPTPALAFDATDADAGEVWQGDAAHFVFRYRNTGTGTLEIDAHPTCGCTVATFDKELAPGAEGKIVADVRTNDMSGKITKVIEVQSNDTDHPQTSLRLSATVKSAFAVEPSRSPVIGLKPGAPTDYELQVRSAEPGPVTIDRITSSAPYVTATASPAGSPGAFKIDVKVDPSAPLGRSMVVLTADTTSKREPQIRVVATCEKGILAMPPSAYISIMGAGTPLPLTRIITLTRRGAPFHITGIETGDPHLQVEQKSLNGGEQYMLTLSYRGGWPAGNIDRKVVVTTDDPAQPRIEIPVHATVVGAAR